MSMVWSVAAGFLAFASPAGVEAPAAAAAPVVEGADTDQLARRGRLIYILDQVAWRSSDLLMKDLPKARQKELAGWIVDRDDDAFTAIYYGLKDGAPYSIFTARYKQAKLVTSGEVKAGEPGALTSRQARLIATREAATQWVRTEGKLPRCSDKPFNIVVIPSASETGRVQVYVLTPQTKTGAYPFGGHYRVTVDSDGKVSGSRAFMKSCMTQELPPNAAAAMVSHLLDPQPTEIHVWLSRWMRKPVFVMVAKPDQLWKVTGEGMSRLEK